MQKRLLLFGLALLMLALLCGCASDGGLSDVTTDGVTAGTIEHVYRGRFIRSTPGNYGEMLFVVEENPGMLEIGEIVWLEFDSPMVVEPPTADVAAAFGSGDRIEVDIRHCGDIAPFRYAPVYAIRLLEDGEPGDLDAAVIDALIAAGLQLAERAPEPETVETTKTVFADDTVYHTYGHYFAVEDGTMWLARGRDSGINDGLPTYGSALPGAAIYMRRTVADALDCAVERYAILLEVGPGLSYAGAFARYPVHRADETYGGRTVAAWWADLATLTGEAYRATYNEFMAHILVREAEEIEAAELLFRQKLTADDGTLQYFILATEAQLTALLDLDGTEAPYRYRLANKGDVLETICPQYPAVAEVVRAAE